jgi:Cdc6-like AAA superfamily ATPase
MHIPDHLPALTPLSFGGLSNEQRLRKIQAERWIGYTKANEALNKLDTLLQGPSKVRMPNLLLTGPTNNGKTMIIEKFKRLQQEKIKKEENNNEQDHESIPVVFIQMPSEPSISRFYAKLLETVNTPFTRSHRVTELERLVLKIFKTVGTKVVVIDEIHNLLAGSSSKQREFLNLLRFLGNELRISLVGVGTKDAYLAIRSDDQLENRFEPLLLPHWQYDHEYLRLLASYLAMLPLKNPSPLTHAAIAEFIFDKSEGTIGETTNLLKAAAVAAIQSGEECINLKVLSRLNHFSPSQRRKLCERELSR